MLRFSLYTGEEREPARATLARNVETFRRVMSSVEQGSSHSPTEPGELQLRSSPGLSAPERRAARLPTPPAHQSSQDYWFLQMLLVPAVAITSHRIRNGTVRRSWGRAKRAFRVLM